jgi:hypothetical protein
LEYALDSDGSASEAIRQFLSGANITGNGLLREHLGDHLCMCTPFGIAGNGLGQYLAAGLR